MTRHDLGISKYAKVLAGEERDFAAWCFKKLTGLRVVQELIKQKKTATTVNLYLMRGDGFLPLSLDTDRHATLRAEYYMAIEKAKRRPTYEKLEVMFIEAEARRLHAEFAYRMLEQRGVKSKVWDGLSDEERDVYREEAKERFI